MTTGELTAYNLGRRHWRLVIEQGAVLCIGALLAFTDLTEVERETLVHGSPKMVARFLVMGAGSVASGEG